MPCSYSSSRINFIILRSCLILLYLFIVGETHIHGFVIDKDNIQFILLSSFHNRSGCQGKVIGTVRIFCNILLLLHLKIMLRIGMGMGFCIQLIEEIVIRITNLSIRTIETILSTIPGGHIPVISPSSTFRYTSILIIFIHSLGNHVLGGHVIHFISPFHKVISVIFPIRICIHPCYIIITRINPVMPGIARKILVCIAYFISSPRRISDTLV